MAQTSIISTIIICLPPGSPEQRHFGFLGNNNKLTKPLNHYNCRHHQSKIKRIKTKVNNRTASTFSVMIRELIFKDNKQVFRIRKQNIERL